MIPDYGHSFADWRGQAGDHWRDYTHHDFVQSLADGTLPEQAFLTYLRQDYLFLIHFSRAWSLAVVKAQSLTEMRAASDMVQALLHHEMALHVSLCGQAGISRAALEATEEAPSNLAYTRYVLETGYSGDYLDLLAALAPCVFGYGEIGARLIAQSRPTPYRAWIETYGGAEYQSLCRATGGMIDQAVTDRLGPQAHDLPKWARLRATFRTATRLEVGFWGLGRA